VGRPKQYAAAAGTNPLGALGGSVGLPAGLATNPLGALLNPGSNIPPPPIV